MKRIILILGIIVAMIAYTACESRSGRLHKEIQSRTQVFVPNDSIIGRGANHTIANYHGDTIIVKNEFTESISEIGYLINIKQ